MRLQTFFDNFAFLADAPNGVQKLRELILHLAMKGKLLSQAVDSLDPSLPQTYGYFNFEVEPSNVETPSTSTLLPSSWQLLPLTEICAAKSGNSKLIKGKLFNEPANDLYQGYSASGADVWCPSWEYDRRAIIISAVGARCGKAFKANGKWCAIANTHIIFPNEDYLDFDYAFLIFNNEKFWIRSGSAQPFVKIRETLQRKFPLPPLEEQKRIVVKVDELMQLCDELEARQQAIRASRTRLNNATLAPLNDVASLTPEELEQAFVQLAHNFAMLYDSAETMSRLRSTILQLAVQGKLVAQDRNAEPASALLKECRKEKDHLIKEKKIKQDKSMLPLTASAALFALPNGWEWVRLNELCSQITDGVHSTPVYTLTGVPFLSVNNLKNNQISFEGCKRISLAEHQQLIKRCKPEQGDILLGKVGSIGVCDVIETEAEFSIFVQLALIKPLRKFVDSYYLKQSLLSETVREQIFSGSAGSALQYIGIGKIQMLIIPLPPLEEQKRIIAKVNQLMALCDELETRLRQAEANSEQLMAAAIQQVLTSIDLESSDESLSVVA